MTRVFLDISKDQSQPFRVEIELFDVSAPKCVENFKALCSGINEKNLSLKNKKMRLFKEAFISGGEQMESIYGETFDFESNELQFNKKFLLGSFPVIDVSQNRFNSSQFFITLKEEFPQLNGKTTIFGQVLNGHDYLQQLNDTANVFDDSLILITDCGILEN